jgi:hypothetical protein
VYIYVYVSILIYMCLYEYLNTGIYECLNTGIYECLKTNTPICGLIDGVSISAVVINNDFRTAADKCELSVAVLKLLLMVF